MKNARNLAIDIFNSIQLSASVSKAEELILSYAEEIRRECADRFCEHKCAWPPNELEHPDECECTERFTILGKGI